ncbi:RNA polymerase-associated protein RapA [Zooshikella harenae]|uniref:RNA polymerase-associated protein RapA n=1 Tax=Zooshikella harenae TaxID=2827238 RepID=A0ABS5Z8E7_9GAMM|nr:RNA polymerase-associated protein RapA [Zooshikella harenae]MBU2710329.1 RNA polymerase-associated protein RapA [Zooshikella harenae]
MTTFAPGQRWISDTETELGLGTILTLDNRLVTLLFPSTGDTRIYSIHNAPLTRVVFNIGDTIENHEGEQVKVTDVATKNDLITYTGSNSIGETVEVPESCLGNFITFNKPQERLLAGQLDQNQHFSLRYKTLQHNHQLLSSNLLGLVGSRTALIPHQLHIAYEVGQRTAPRVLLADEVGLGKTIEAGLIIYQQLLSMRAQRVLVIVPETLQHQWLVELLRRFNLHFSLFDLERCQQYPDENPFDSAQLVLTSLEFLSQHPIYHEQCCKAGWDLMIVDEAHHLTWSIDQPSKQYLCIEKLAHATPGVLLLTATPEQLGKESHFARLRLLDPIRFHSLEAFIEEETAYTPVAKAVQNLIELDSISEDTAKLLLTFTSTEQHRAQDLINVIQTSKDNDEREQAKSSLINILLDRHGTSRVLFRNTRAGVHGFPGRLVQPYPQQIPELYKLAWEDSEKLEEFLFPEIAYQQRITVDDKDPWWRFDPRVDWLLTLLKALKGEKILLICANATTALDLDEAIRVRSGIPSAVFEEGMSIIERDRAAAYFADQEYGSQILICSEIGSEGRNFQFAHHLVLFDLPLNPDLLEQRIGRLDRIGQTEAIRIHVPYFESSSQALVYSWYHDGLNAFLDTCPAGTQLYSLFQKEIITLCQQTNPFNDDKWPTLLKNTQQQLKQIAHNLHEGRDRLLELNSQGNIKSFDLINALQNEGNSKKLRKYTEKLFSCFGIDHEDHSKDCIVVRPSEQMLVPSFPGLQEEGMTMTFSRDIALSREDIHFLTWEHPLLRNGMEMLLDSEFGNTTVALLKNKALKPGTMLVEAIYVVVPPVEHRQLHRFLPPTSIRTLIDPKGNDLNNSVNFDTLDAQLHPLKKKTARKLVKAQHEPIMQTLKLAENAAAQQMPDIVKSATQTFKTTLGAELERLQALKEVNPNIREEEITHLQQTIASGLSGLSQAQLRLDAVRVMFAG